MTGYKRVNFYELCRLCTSSQPKDKVHIFREEGRKMQLQQKIQSCFPLLVCEHDYLPKVVCTSCIQALDQCYTFRQNCINSETMLSSYFSNFRFTDDFKKAGKVYVKDTGQKPENINQNVNSPKKTTQENFQPNITSQVISDGNQQYFTLELPAVPNKNIQNYTKLPVTNNVPNNTQNKEFTSISTTPNVINTPKQIPEQQIKFNPKPNDNQSNLIPCNVTSLNFNGNLIQPNKISYEQKLNNNIEPNQIEFNVMKMTNVGQPMMLIDIEQLIESGLPESEINKLKEVLLKPVDFKSKPQMSVHTKLPTDETTNQILNNLNNNQVKQENNMSVKTFKCEICDKLFKRREHLHQHTKLHSGLRPFNCVHCPKTFSRKEHLMRHLTSHSGVKDFSCEICNKKFSRPDNLKKHKKTHQKTNGPFVCEICQKSFVIKHYYLAHKMQHYEGETALGNIMKTEGGEA